MVWILILFERVISIIVNDGIVWWWNNAINNRLNSSQNEKLLAKNSKHIYSIYRD